MSSHVIITGTGRAGTSFLVQLLTRLGLDTGYDPRAVELPLLSRAGLETDVRAPNAPYIVKSPHLCDLIEEVLTSSVQIEHAIIPIRQFDAAAASRAHVHELVSGSADANTIWGGLWDTARPDQQAAVLRSKFTKLIETLVRHDIPITFLAYPRLVRDPDYLYSKLAFLLGDRDLVAFRTAFSEVVRPEWVHQFTADDC